VKPDDFKHLDMESESKGCRLEFTIAHLCEAFRMRRANRNMVAE
jgi:hypothetical protein